MQIKFITIRELGKMVYKMLTDNIYNSAINFTPDTQEVYNVNCETSEWYGIMITRMFDIDVICIGYYGGGFFWAKEAVNDLRKINSPDLIAEMLVEMFNLTSILDREVTANSEICAEFREDTTCPNCNRNFELTSIEKDVLGWHTSCPYCEGSFDVNVSIN